MIVRTVLAATALVALAASAVIAQQDPIAARKELMKANGQAAQLGTKMSRGEEPFTVEKGKSVFVNYQKVATAGHHEDRRSRFIACRVGEQGRFRSQAHEARHRGQGRGREGHGSRFLQGAVHRGAEELRRLSPDLPQAPVLRRVRSNRPIALSALGSKFRGRRQCAALRISQAPPYSRNRACFEKGLPPA